MSGSHSQEMDVRLCVVLLAVGGTLAFSGKGFYCRDPDTGKLHPVNTTWRSTTFCGNYTCKLKKKDLLNTTPLREFQVSNVDISGINIPQIEKKILDVQNGTDEGKQVANILDKILSNINDPNQQQSGNEIIIKEKTDRFLNDKEIKIISEMLYSVKKSDLEAIVDIYNLAQDIYNELDKKTSENLVEETVNEIQMNDNEKQNEKEEILSKSNPKRVHNKLSYWYEPLLIPKGKQILDMKHEGSETVPSVYPIPKYDRPSKNTATSLQNYGKLPYFYEISNFQRQSSYVHPTSPNPVSPERQSTQHSSEKTPPLQNTFLNPFSLDKHIQQPVLLPFPYYQVRYNASGYPSNYYYRANPYQAVSRSQYDKYYVTRAPHIEKGNTSEKSYKPGSLLDSLLSKEDSSKKTIPDWKTDSLGDDALEDIRAHFENKNKLFKPLCLRKKIKLEKVGKVFKLENVDREKRSISENGLVNGRKDEDYEVFIERTTCQSDVDPGFFRMGNDSAPFPACCPQRISR